MLLKSDTVHEAWAATERTVDVKMTIKGTKYNASDVTSLTFDSGAMNGEALTLGSTYQNTIKIVFSHLIEGLKLTDEITPELGIKLPDGTWDYTPLGVFVIDTDITQDRNNNTTSVSASDRMCMMGGTYESKLTYPAAINDIAVEIANLAAVKLNEDDFARLPTDKVASFGKVTYRDAIGFVAQFAGGFATFDRDGLLDIRQLADPNFDIAPSQYQSKGLAKNEALYRIGGISCSVTTTTKDSSGSETQETTTLQSGSTAGTQITISNPGMTQDLLDGLYEQLQDLNFYPFSLSWFGDPNVEAGDWIEVQDTAGNVFKTPNLLYTLTFSGGVTATSKADTTVSASANFVYKGQLNQTVENIRQYLNASGHAVSEGIDEPTNPKAGDIWFKAEGPDTTIMTYVVDPETGLGSWVAGPSTKPNTKITDALQKAEADTLAAQKQADDAVAKALAAVSASGLATASVQAASDAATAAKQLATQVSNTFSTVQSQATTAASDAATALEQAKSALAIANGVSGDYKSIKQIVDDTAGTIKTLATSASVDAVKQTVTTTKSLAEQTANGLTLKADTSVVNTLSGTVKQQGIDLAAAQGELKLKLTQSDLTKGLSGYATQTWAQNQITATANTWSTQLNSLSAKYDSMSLGTRNYIQDSSFELGKMTIAGVSAGYKASFIGAQTAGDFPTPFGSQMLQFYQPTGVAAADAYVILALPQPIQIKAGETWTTSYYYAVAGGMQGVAASNYLLKSSSAGDVIGNAGAHFQYPGGDHSAWTRAVFTWTATADGVVSALRFGAVSTSTTAAWVVIDNIQLEKGNIVSDHHPAPEDSAIYTDQRSAELSITLDQYKQQLAATTTTANTATTNIQSMQATVTSTSSLLATVQTTVGSLRSAGANLVYNGDAELGLDGWTSNHMNLTGLSTHNYWYNGTKQFFRLYPNGTGTNDENCFSSKSIPVKRNTIYHLHFHWIAPMDISSIDVLQGQTSADYLTNAWKPASDSGVYDKDFNTGNRDSVVIRIDLNGSTDGNANVWLGLSEICLTEGAGIVPYSPSAANSATVTAFNSVQSTVDGTVQSIGSINGQLTTINNSIKGVQTTVAGKASTSQFTQLDNQITSVIGGLSNPNLILNSKYPTDKSLLGWLDTSNLTIAVHNFYSGGGATLFEIVNATKGTDSTSEKTVGTNRFKLTRNTDYTVSLWAFASGNTSGMDVYILKRKRGSTNAFDNDGVVQLMSNNTKLSAIQTVKYTLHFNSGDFDEAYLRVDNNGSTDGTNSVLFFAEPKVELGSLATPDVQSGTDSQITQLQDAINLRVTKDGIISQINMTAGKTLIQNNTILLDASTVTMGGTAFINAANIKSVNATTITAGKLDASLIDVVGLNAKSIATGTITGANLAINLNTGQVTFQKGRIHSSDNAVDVNIDQKYLSVADGQSRILLKGGEMQFIQPTYYDTQTSPYMKITNNLINLDNGFHGASIQGRDYVSLTVEGLNDPTAWTGSGFDTFAGIRVSRNDSSGLATVIGGGNKGTVISGGGYTKYAITNRQAMIRIGYNRAAESNGDFHYWGGNEILIDAENVYIPSAYYKTASGSSNVIIDANGRFVRSTSASKYKTNIERSNSTAMAEALLTLPTAHWLDKAEMTRYVNGDQTQAPKLNFGMIAEDLAAAGLEDLVVRGDTGELEGINYDRIAPALLPLLAKMKQEIEELKGEKSE